MARDVLKRCVLTLEAESVVTLCQKEYQGILVLPQVGCTVFFLYKRPLWKIICRIRSDHCFINYCFFS